ncbi:MAG: hypothetical protein GF368_00120 [Candidatus Aenigmarchaeota archaeon]|nr:hypothetical protein [Candidatus Aenigmarchaeota archaeon]
MLDRLSHKELNYVFLLVISVLFLAFLLNEAKKEVTGFIPASISVESNTKIRVTAFDYPIYPDFGEFVNVTIEVQNSGSNGYDEQIEVFIKNSTMDQLSYYYDAVTRLEPGERKSFKLVYLPPDYGVYYIQLRVSYAETRRLETWGAFVVYEEPVSNGTTPATTIEGEQEEIESAYGDYYIAQKDYISGRPAPSKKPHLKHRLRIDLPTMIDITKGETSVTYVNVKNVGNSTIHGLKITKYTQGNIEADIFPTFLPTLAPNTSSIFMLSVKAPFEIEPDVYPLDLVFSSDEVDIGKKLLLNVTDLNLKDLVYQTILNYKFILAEFENQMEDASEDGIDISELELVLEPIKYDLNITEEHYNSGEYHLAYQKLQIIHEDIQDMLLRFAIIRIPIKVFLKKSYIIIFLGLLVLILIIVLLYLYRKSKKELKRPKLLKELSEESPK